MGCDIHLYIEKHVNGEWVTADVWESSDYGDDENSIDVPWEKRFTGRNYNLFGLLSKGVRREFPFSFKPRGLPFNACQEIANNAEAWGCDGHSHSYLYLHELKDMREFLKTATLKISGMKDRDELAALRASIASDSPNWDLLYPYCQFTGMSSYEEFEIDVPASYIVGGDLDDIISSFEGVDGDNHRIVFFFDN